MAAVAARLRSLAGGVTAALPGRVPLVAHSPEGTGMDGLEVRGGCQGCPITATGMGSEVQIIAAISRGIEAVGRECCKTEADNARNASCASDDEVACIVIGMAVVDLQDRRINTGGLSGSVCGIQRYTQCDPVVVDACMGALA
jgi:hypothetical protein